MGIVDPATKARLLDELMEEYEKLLINSNGFSAIECYRLFFEKIIQIRVRNEKYSIDKHKNILDSIMNEYKHLKENHSAFDIIKKTKNFLNFMGHAEIDYDNIN